MTVGESLARAREGSVVVGLLATVVAALRRWVGASTVGARLRRGQHVTSVAVERSWPARGGRRLLTWLRASSLYRWLTAEPDPQVVVIDLRTTRTVGPLVRALDWTLDRLVRFTRRSRLFRTGAGVADAIRRAPIRVVGLVVCVVAVVHFGVALVAGTVGWSGVVRYGVVLLVGVAGTRVRVPLSALAEARTVELLRAAFEPPEPPERSDREATRRSHDE